MNIKKFLVGAAATGLMLASAVPAFASPAADNAQCGTDASSGAFVGGGTGGGKDGNYSFLGEVGGAAGYHDAVGQELAGPDSISSAPGATGYNNSHVCGNP